jgi:hypothetical protein
MSQEQSTKEFNDRTKNMACRDGWEDGRFGPTQPFLTNSNLAKWADHQERLSHYRGIATGGGSARCWRTGTLLDTGLRSYFMLYSAECVKGLFYEVRHIMGFRERAYSAAKAYVVCGPCRLPARQLPC